MTDAFDTAFRQLNSLVEEWVVDGIYTSTSAQEIADKLKNARISLRVFYDANIKRYFICDADKFIHRDMVDAAVENGYYPELYKWEIDSYMDTCEEDDTITYLLFAPKGLEEETYGSSLGEDGYLEQFIFDFGTLTIRGNEEYKNSKLAKALGPYKEHYIQDGWIDNYKPNIKKIN